MGSHLRHVYHLPGVSRCKASKKGTSKIAGYNFVSVASAWELWIKHTKKPIIALAPVLDSGAAAFLKATRESGIAALDITLDHAAKAAALPGIHRDPFDRMLIAQAMAERLTIMTDDTAFKRYKDLRLIAA